MKLHSDAARANKRLGTTLCRCFPGIYHRRGRGAGCCRIQRGVGRCLWGGEEEAQLVVDVAQARGYFAGGTACGIGVVMGPMTRKSGELVFYQT